VVVLIDLRLSKLFGLLRGLKFASDEIFGSGVWGFPGCQSVRISFSTRFYSTYYMIRAITYRARQPPRTVFLHRKQDSKTVCHVDVLLDPEVTVAECRDSWWSILLIFYYHVDAKAKLTLQRE
jgi:hypothetical protein